MKMKIILCLLLSLGSYYLSSQVPQGFNYQAIARDAAGAVIADRLLPVRITIQTSEGTVIWEEEHLLVRSNQFGLISLVVGKGTPRRPRIAEEFLEIDWNAQPLFLKTTIQYPNTTWTEMGTAPIWSVPYSLVARDVEGPITKLGITGITSDLEEALFEVRNKDGQTIFAVYNEGVRIYVDDGDPKGAKGGFAVGGFGDSKAPSQKYMFMSEDSIRLYIDDIGKGAKGGFAVGGFGDSKAESAHFLDVATNADGIINPSENRILWYPLKNALLTGRVLITSPENVGENSFATGYESKASGLYSQAMGYKTVAAGDFSTAIGINANALNTNSFAFGDSPEASGVDSYAFGAGAVAKGTGSYALGSFGRDASGNLTSIRTTASGDYSFALGLGSVASGLGAFTFGVSDTAAGWFSTATGIWNKVEPAGWCATANGIGTRAGNYAAAAFGDHSYAKGHTSFATGFMTTAAGQLSSAFGDATTANGWASTALGRGTVAETYGSLAIGSFNAIIGSSGEWNFWYPVFSIGNGTSSADRSNAMTFYNSGIADFEGFVNLSTNPDFNEAIKVRDAQALWYNGTYFSWGYGGSYNVFADPVSVGTTANPGSYALYVAGNAMTTGSWGTSDIRWKKDLAPLRNTLPELLKLQGFKYSWRDDEYPDMNFGKEKQIGLIAQDVEKTFPELVRTDGNGYKAVSYEKLTVILLEGMKEQQRQIESVRQKNLLLESELQSLKEDLEKMRAMLVK